MDHARIFRFLRNAESRGQRAALVSLIRTTGGSMREAGAHMAVTENGDYLGSLSGGCIERAVAAEAVEAIGQGSSRVTRYGAGSPFIDIRLPCGGGVDVHIQPWADPQLTANIIDRIDDRQPFTLELGLPGRKPLLRGGWQPVFWDEESGLARVGHWPIPRILIIGQGENVTALVEAAKAWNADCEVASQEASLVARVQDAGLRGHHLNSPQAASALVSDKWSAIAILFHDHEWEVPVIKALIGQPHFYFGVMGSKATHTRRCAALLCEGVSQAAINTMCAPIGLIPASRDPATLAISILAQIVEYHRQADFAALEESAA